MFGLPVSGVELQNPWNFLCAESYKGVFFMLMSVFWKAPTDGSWLPGKTTNHMIRGLKFLVPLT